MRDSVAVICKKLNGDFLFHQRGDLRTWGLPGGRIEVDESYEAAATRETLEETDVVCTIVDLVAIVRRPQMPNGGYRLFLYSANFQEARSFSTFETAAIQWGKFDELCGLKSPFLKALLSIEQQFTGTTIETELKVAGWKALLGRAAFKVRDLLSWI